MGYNFLNMKLSKTILSGFLFSFFFFGNGFSQCENSAIEYINANKVRASVLNDGSFFMNANGGTFMVPFTLGDFPTTSTIWAGALWLGGIDETGGYKISRTDFQFVDYTSGPIDDNTLNIFDDGCKHFDRIWKISREDILGLKEDFEDNGVIDQPVSYNIKIWPAKGNPFFEETMGFSLPDQELAPFFDRNNNGSFDPQYGEYPLINPSMPNAIPNEMTWSVFNNTANTENGFSEIATGTEIHFMTYAFNCSENNPLNYTVFTQHKIINKSGGDLSGFKIGIWLDPDLGCYADDYFGCDTLLNAQYIYNSDNDDNDFICTGIGTYGENPPVQAITFLNKKLSNFGYYNNAGINNPPPGTWEPTDVVGFYNYLSGKWRDGSQLSYGGSGYGQPGDFVNHVFPDPPFDPNGWNMVNEQLPQYDQRTIMSTGLSSLPVGAEIILDAAFSYHREPGSDHIENVDVALSEIPSIQAFYDSGFSNECMQVVKTTESVNLDLSLDISPNPNNGVFNLFFEKTNTVSHIRIFDFSGKMIFKNKIPAEADQHNIDLKNELSAGIYFIKWTLPDGQFTTRKVMVK